MGIPWAWEMNRRCRGTRLRFHEATALTPQLREDLQHTVRKRVLRHVRRHGFLEPHEVVIDTMVA